jgi:hypothetical protein
MQLKTLRASREKLFGLAAGVKTTSRIESQSFALLQKKQSCKER